MADVQDAVAPRSGQRDPAGVLIGRHGVEELGPASGRGGARDGLLEGFRDQPVVVHGHVHHVGLVGREGAQRAHVGGRLDQHHVAGVDEDPGHQVQGLL